MSSERYLFSVTRVLPSAAAASDIENTFALNGLSLASHTTSLLAGSTSSPSFKELALVLGLFLRYLSLAFVLRSSLCAKSLL